IRTAFFPAAHRLAQLHPSAKSWIVVGGRALLAILRPLVGFGERLYSWRSAPTDHRLRYLFSGIFLLPVLSLRLCAECRRSARAPPCSAAPVAIVAGRGDA